MKFQTRTGLLTLTAILSCVHLAVGGQHTTPWGDPDLQGMWSSSALVTVPFERPKELGTRAVLTEDELTARNIAAATRARPKTNPPTGWGESRPAPAQASLVIDPENGRLPPLT